MGKQKNASGNIPDRTEKQDTIDLLKECDAGTKMAVTAIDDVIDCVENEDMCKMLNKSKAHHTKLGNEIHEMLDDRGISEKDPSMMAESMSKMKTNFKLMMDPSDSTIAGLITDGCNMGIKSLYEYLNDYEDADESIKDICHRLIRMEEQLCDDMTAYL